MKKAVVSFLSLSVLTFSAITATAQESTFASYQNSTSSHSNSIAVDDRSSVNSEVLKSFETRYKNVSEVNWSVNQKTTSVSFVKDGTSMRCTYDQKGRLEYTLAYYKTGKLPTHIIREVRRSGYTMPITQVIEVVRRNTTTNIVKMEDNYRYVTLKLQDGDLEVHEDFRKQK